MFNHNRLSLARKRRRLTGKRLAELVGVTAVTISRLENGSHEPEPETLARLARALNYPIEFFEGDDLDELVQCAASFRSLKSMSAKERDASLAAGSLAFLLNDWVGERFNLPEPNLLDLNYEIDPETAARTVRERWNLGEKPIPDMIRLLESRGVRVFSLSENSTSVDAFSCWRDDTPFMFLNNMKTAEHARFDAGHELGHLILHKHGGPKQARSAEFEANRFASAFLMPAGDVQARLPSVMSMSQIIQAKFRWRVSAMALAYRTHQMGIVSDWRYRSFCIELGRRGYCDGEPGGIEHEQSVIWRKVLSQLWRERITKTDIAADLHLPIEELEGLVFGLNCPKGPQLQQSNDESEFGLRLVK